MKCWGSPSNLKGGVEALKQYNVPTPAMMRPSDVLVKVEAASLNPLDIAMLGWKELKLSYKNYQMKFLHIAS